MDGYGILLAIFLWCHFLFVGRVQCNQRQSTYEDLEKTIQDKYGNIYDCIDIYKQVAFDHPLLKNHTIDFQMIANPFNHKTDKNNSSESIRFYDTFLKAVMCPVGTIPIRRLFIQDTIEERQAGKAKKVKITNRPNTHLAVARTKSGSGRYSGAQGDLKLDNPKVVGQQFSATRLKLQAGQDSIEVGWRIDPSLYGDSHSRLFIRTDVGTIHCFNIRCPGFIQTYHGISLDFPFKRVSVPGDNPVLLMQFFIIKDNRTGNWNFLLRKKDFMLNEDIILIGYWPSQIFTQMVNLADRVEWGGTAYSPLGTPLPPMGTGNFPVGTPVWDGTICNLKVITERGQTVDGSDLNLETYADKPILYSVSDNGYHYEFWGRMIFYGGPGHK